MAIKFLSGLNLSDVTAGSILKLDSNGNIVAATAGTDYLASSLWTASGSNIYYSSGNVTIGTSSNSAPLHVYGYQTTDPKILIEDGNTGDASMQFKISTQQYTMGIDNSDGDKFKFSSSTAFGTNNIFTINTNSVSFLTNVFNSGIIYTKGSDYGILNTYGSLGNSYAPQEGGTASTRYWVMFDYTNNASYPFLTNRTPSGAVVIKTGTAAGGGENEHFRIKGGDGTVDAYFTNANLGISTTSPTSALDVSGIITTRNSSLLRRYVSTWTNADTHDVLYNGWTSTMGDYVYLKAQGNSTGGHGMILVGDNVAYIGRSDVETGSVTGLDQTWATFKNGGVGIGTTSPSTNFSVRATTATHQLVGINRANSDTAALYLGNNSSNDAIISGNNAPISLGKDVSGTYTEYVNIATDGELKFSAYGAGILKTNASGIVSVDTATYVTDVDWSDINSINGTININSTTQIGQGDTETLVSFQNSGTERGRFEVDDSANSYFVATGFKTSTASTGFLKANGTVDTSSYLTSVAFSDITSKPTTLAGYGITDGATVDYVDTEVSGLASESWANTNLVNVTGDTMTGDLTIKRGHGDLTFLTLKQENTSGDLVEQKSFIDFTFVDSNTNETPQVRIGAEVGNNDGSASSLAEEGMGAFVVYTNNADTDAGAAGTSLAERFRVDYSGKVGIGTANPNYKLDVNGTLRATTLYSPIVRVSGSSDHLTLRSDVQVDQGATDPIIEFAYGTTQMGKFDQDGYMYATGFKTTTASTGLLKADGTVDTTTLGTMASESASDYKDSDTVESYVAQELASYTTTSSFGSNAFTSYTDHSTQGYLTSYTETDTLNSVTGRGATTTNNISVGNLTAVGGTFTDPVTIYDSTTTENPRLSVGRNAGESIQFGVTDVVNTITAKQDSDSDGDHTFVLDRVFAGSGDSAFSIHNDGTPDLTINGSGVVSFNQYNTAGILQVNTSGTISVDTSSYLTSYTETDTLDSVTDRGATTTNAITTGGITADYGYFGSTSTAPQVRIYTENASASIADTFADTSTDKSYIYFMAGTNSNDPGYIMHETSESASPDERNEGVLHLVPSDDNSTGDYVSIHGTNDADVLKLHTSGLIETATGYQLVLKSGNASVKVDDTLHVTGRLYVDTLDANTTSTSALVEGASGEIEKRTLGSAAFSTATDFVAVSGDTMSGTLTFSGNGNNIIIPHSSNNTGNIIFAQDGETYHNIDFSAYEGMIGFYNAQTGSTGWRWRFGVNGTNKDKLYHTGFGGYLIDADGDYNGTWQGYSPSSLVATIVDSAPAALDTLNELAAALGDDANFSTTMSTALGNRLRIDVSDQNLTATQKSNASTNLGLGTAATSAATDFVAVSGDTMTGALRIQEGASDQSTSADSTSVPSTTGAEFMRIEGGYTNGQYTHEFAKIDRGGNLPLYIRQSKGTANSFVNLARFGDHSYSAHEFEVFGSIKASGGDSGQWNTAYTYSQVGHLPLAGGTLTGGLTISAAANTAWLASFTNTSASGHGLIIQAGGTTGTRYITQWKDAAGTERFHMDDTGEAYFQNTIQATGGINGLTLANGGISGTNFNITGVNQLEIADPGEGIVFKSGSSGDMTLAIVDDTADNILRFSGTNAVFDVAGDLSSTNLTIADSIIHEGDADTKISFTTDVININTGGGVRASISDSTSKFNNDVVIIGGETLSLGERAEGDDLGRTVLIEGVANAANGEGSGRIFFTGHNSTTAAADSYGLSLYYEGDPNAQLPSGFQPNTGNATWSLRRHDNSVNGVAIMSGTRSSSNVTFSGDLIAGGNKYTLTVNAPTNVTTSVVNETINVTFDASTTSDIDYYLVFSSVAGGDYGLISVIPPQDFGATMSIIDNSFDSSGTQAYRVYAVKNGVYSSAGTSSRTYTVTTPLEPTNMSVVNLNSAYYIQWDKPSTNARFVTAYNVYKHEAAAQASLSRNSATLIYSGTNTSYMYQISGTDNNNYHQFWVETTVG